MKSKLVLICAFLAIVVLTSGTLAQQTLVVKADQPIADIQPTMWGIFFEDINFAADGGLYAEMIKNRSFEFFMPLTGWKELKSSKGTGSCLIENRAETNPSNPHFAHISVDENKGTYGLSNEGFRGMGVKKSMTYHFSLFARQIEGAMMKLRIELVDSNKNVIGKASLIPDNDQWKKYTVDLLSDETDPKAKLNIWFQGIGSIDVDMISLFPDDTWKNRPNGLRADLVQLLADLKPGFLRFPGGCIVEGRNLETRYQWKKTIGPDENRKVIVNRWNTEFKHRPTPDYFQSFGLGFFEYFQLAEDIGAEPLPILNCGMACQFNTAEVASMDQLDPYVQDALDLIEFANGTPATKWGKIRSDLGHPAPFNLKLLGIGNEQWGPQYFERYKIFVKAIKERYPKITLVTGTGPSPDGELFDYATKELKNLNADIVDEHYYKNPDWFLQNTTRYDNYDRKSYKIFAGEYAAQSVAVASPANKNNWQCALSEAAFMTGLERNAGVVYMASYAPLFAHVQGWQWTPNLIWFDNLRSYGTPNYYVQKLFSTNKGTQVLPILDQDKPVTGQNKLYATAAFDKNTNEIILKIVNASDKVSTNEIQLTTSKRLDPKAKLIVLKSDHLSAVNSLDNPKQISPAESTINLSGKTLKLIVEPSSMEVVRIKLK